MGPEDDAGYIAEGAVVSFNSRRDEYLVVWDGNGPSEARRPCGPPAPGPPGSPGPTPIPGPCFEYDTEIYARRLDSHGHPLGEQHRITAIGPPDQTEAKAYSPSVAYNRRSKEYLVTFTGHPTGELSQGEVFAQRLDGTGREIGADDGQLTHRGLQSVGIVAYNRHAGDYMLVYGAGSGPPDREVYAQRLSRHGEPIGERDIALTKAGGQRETPEDLVFNPRTRGYILAVEAQVEPRPKFEVHIGRLTAAGRAPNGLRVVPRSDSLSPSPAISPDRRGGRYLLAWSRSTEFDREIYGLPYSAGLRRLARRPFRISKMGPDVHRVTPDQPSHFASLPDVAPLLRPGEFVTVWQGLDDDDGNSDEIYAREVER